MNTDDQAVCGNPASGTASSSITTIMAANGVQAEQGKCLATAVCSSGIALMCNYLLVDGQTISLPADQSNTLAKALSRFSIPLSSSLGGKTQVKLECRVEDGKCSANGKADPSISSAASGGASGNKATNAHSFLNDIIKTAQSSAGFSRSGRITCTSTLAGFKCSVLDSNRYEVPAIEDPEQIRQALSDIGANVPAKGAFRITIACTDSSGAITCEESL